MKIFMVVGVDYSEKNIFSVHSTREGAEAARIKVQASEYGEWYGIKIEEHDLQE